MNWDKHKFHPSALGSLMTNDRSGKNVGETCKKELLDIWVEVTYGRTREFTNKYMEKGTEVEERSMDLYSLQRKRFFKKNIITFENEYFIGTPDIVDEQSVEVIDLKSCWSLHTFFQKIHQKIEPAYEYQLQGYMDLLSTYGILAQQGRLAYVLVDTPLYLLQREKDRFRYNFEEIDPDTNPEYVAGIAQIEKNGEFSDIPEADRWMEFIIQKRSVKDVYDRLDWCRAFLQKLTDSKFKSLSESLIVNS